MRSLLFGVLFLAFAACAQEGSEAAATAGETASTTAAATDTNTTTAAETTSAAPAPGAEEKPMSNHENKVAELHTTAGQINIIFFPDVAPNHVKNFIDLATQGFYEGTKFHRVIPGFMIQGGDPNTKAGDPSTWGTGGAPQNVKAEFNTVSHKRGIVSMARSQHPDSASSQFFICVADSPFLDRQYTAFGQVIKGMEVADQIVAAERGANDRPKSPTTITKIVVRDATETEKVATPK